MVQEYQTQLGPALCYHTSMSGRGYGSGWSGRGLIGGGRGQIARVFGNLLRQILNRAIQLDVVAVEQSIRIQVEFFVWINPVAFDDPIFALRVPTANSGCRNVSAIAQGLVAANANPAAPGARADDRPHFELFESKRECFAIAAALAVDETSHVTVECV